MEKVLWEAIRFAVFLVLCGALAEFRFSRRTRAVAAGGILAGILILQGAMHLAGGETVLLLTLLPLTAYLPAIVGLHVLSSAGFFPTAAVWTVGLAACFTLAALRKCLLLLLGRLDLPGWQAQWLLTGCLFLAAAAVAVLAVRRLQKPFRFYVFHTEVRWLPLCLPALMVLLLFSYFINTTTNALLLGLLLATVVAVFWMLTGILASAAELARLRETERVVQGQLPVGGRGAPVPGGAVPPGGSGRDAAGRPPETPDAPAGRGRRGDGGAGAAPRRQRHAPAGRRPG